MRSKLPLMLLLLSSLSFFLQITSSGIWNIQRAIFAAGLQNRIKVTTAFDQTELLHQSFPLGYSNVFDAMVDGVYSALEKAGGSSLDIVVSEIGWPTASWSVDNHIANNQNAETHNNRLIHHVGTGGRPKRPEKRIETYIYALFDENLKGDESQRHWGSFGTITDMCASISACNTFYVCRIRFRHFNKMQFLLEEI